MQRTAGIVLGTVAWMALAGCAPAPLEMFSDNPPGKSGPTINQIIRHVDCEFEYAVNGDRSHMSDFAKYEYIAQATLTVDVTDTEGLNPSLSFITPFAPVGPPFGSMTMSTTNKTWTLGAQLSGTQHRTVIVTLQADLNQFLHTPANAAIVSADFATGHPSECPVVRANAGSDLAFDRSAIQGDLGLGEAMEDGLTAIYSNGTYGIVISPATALPDCGPNPEKPSGFFSFNSDARRAAHFAGRYNACPGAPAPVANPTTFSSQTDFTVVEGLSGGPSWSLVHFKGPTAGGGGGSGGSGGGSSGSGAGSGSGGASGGGSQGPISINRQAKDTMLIAFTARCDSTRPGPSAQQKTYFDTLPGCGVEEKLHGAELLRDELNRPISNGVNTEKLNSATPNALNSLQNATTQAELQALSPNL